MMNTQINIILNEPLLHKRTHYDRLGSTKRKLTLAITLINSSFVNGFEMTTGFVLTICLCL